MTPRGTDWSLAALVALLVITGVLTLFAGRPDDAWIFVVHDAGAGALVLVVAWKLRRVGRRVPRLRGWDRRTAAGLSATALVLVAFGSGIAWSSGAQVYFAGFGLMNWHFVLGLLLALGVAVHLGLRAKPVRRRDLMHRRQFLHAAGITAAGIAAWRVQRPLEAWLGWRGARRRFTGSYEADSFAGNAFPATSWVADHPAPLDTGAYRLAVGGLVRTPLAVPLGALGAPDELIATLDCTGGFHSTQRWRGVFLGRLLDRAGARSEGGHVRVISRTGYRWSFGLRQARGLLLATHVGEEPLSHDHGAPVRLVAPGHRGFEWVKWVVRIELHAGGDPGAPASTVWSSFSRAGRGEA